ncbi:MAG TPA: aminotransferase class V-fold PLP-dependent enzyme, partial [Cyclobacteriaceae bacterium]|nr:aminotransferase class V-fold PLP-dependent enzyme [Cyclobacteriaceae bacterium]
MDMLENDRQHFDDILEDVKSYCSEFLSGADIKNLWGSLPESRIDHLPENGIGAREAFKLFLKTYEPIFTGRCGPRFLGYVNGGVTPAALAGDWLTTTFDFCPQMGIADRGDLTPWIELETLNLIKELLSIPQTFCGGFVSGATMSNFTGLAVARQWAGKQLGKDFAEDGIDASVWSVLSATAHSSSIKALSMLGMGRRAHIKIHSIEDRECIDVGDLEIYLNKLGSRPAIIIANAGTVNTGDFDEIEAIVNLKKKYNIWIHVDGAFGGLVACSPKHAHLVKGWDQVDSITVDTHKWMNLPYDSGLTFIHPSHKEHQYDVFKLVNAQYLGSDENFRFNNNTPETSRRMRSLPAWISLIAYGRHGFRQIVENCVEHAQTLGKLIGASEDYELLAPVRLNVVCFTVRQSTLKNLNTDVPKIMEKINARGI